MFSKMPSRADYYVHRWFSVSQEQSGGADSSTSAVSTHGLRLASVARLSFHTWLVVAGRKEAQSHEIYHPADRYHYHRGVMRHRCLYRNHTLLPNQMSTTLFQGDLFSAPTPAPRMPVAVPSATRRRTVPIIIGGLPPGKTADLDTLVVDGIKNLTYIIS